MDQYQKRLELQLAEVAAFIERDTKLLSESPDSLSLQVALRSWQDHHKELSFELQALTQDRDRGLHVVALNQRSMIG